MKATGIVRRIDPLGRLVIPKETRRTLGISEGDSLEIFTDKGGEVILKKYQPGCIFCGELKNLTEFKDKIVCEKCSAELGGM